MEESLIELVEGRPVQAKATRRMLLATRWRRLAVERNLGIRQHNDGAGDQGNVPWYVNLDANRLAPIFVLHPRSVEVAFLRTNALSGKAAPGTLSQVCVCV